MPALVSTLPVFSARYEQLDVGYKREDSAVWARFQAKPRPCFTPKLLTEMTAFHRQITDHLSSEASEALPVHYLVVGSSVPGIYNLGGDLHLFKQYITAGDREGLRSYAYACIDVLFQNAINLNLPLTTIALVQGSALGGGFEAALSCNVIIAERGTDFGFPEILFNLFPGMGAYSLLARRVAMNQAEKLITSGRTYKAEDLYEMGVVDVLAEEGEGEEAVRRFIRRHSRTRQGFDAIQRVRQRVNPLTYEELADITDMWVDAALALTERDLRLIDLLVRSQDQNAQAKVFAEAASSGTNVVSHPARFG